VVGWLSSKARRVAWGAAGEGEEERRSPRGTRRAAHGYHGCQFRRFPDFFQRSTVCWQTVGSDDVVPVRIPSISLGAYL